MTICLMCSAIKKATNNWWCLTPLDDRSYSVYPFPHDVGVLCQCSHLVTICGEGCLVKAEQMIRDGQSLPERPLER